MPELWIIAGVVIVAGVGLAIRLNRSRPAEPTECEFVPAGRDGDLAVQLAKIVGCTPLLALDAVRHELDLAPTQTDEVILKRAAYHYRNNLPEREQPRYRDKVRG
jgi:hypothetical protein